MLLDLATTRVDLIHTRNPMPEFIGALIDGNISLTHDCTLGFQFQLTNSEPDHAQILGSVPNANGNSSH